MHRLGLFGSEPVAVDGVSVIPRYVFGAVATPALDRGEPDVVLMRTTVVGTRAGTALRRVYQMIEYPEHGLTAMMRCTAFPATVVLLMLARGQITEKGALPQERCVDPDRFLTELAQRNITVEVTEEPV